MGVPALPSNLPPEKLRRLELREVKGGDKGMESDVEWVEGQGDSGTAEQPVKEDAAGQS